MAIFHITFMAETLCRTVPLTVILPTDKSYFDDRKRRDPDRPYKTLYLLHGILGDNTDWLYGTRIARWAMEKELCVVMPSGENMFYIDQQDMGNLYGEFIGRELVEFTRKTFPLSHKREDTYIGGLSMGGYGAIRNGLKYSDTFGAIIGLSAGLIIDEDILIRNPAPRFPADTMEWKMAVYGRDFHEVLKSDKNPRVLIEQMLAGKKAIPDMFLACGTEDFLLEKNTKFVEFLRERKVPVQFETAPGAHEWDFWDTWIKKAIDWLPLEDGTEGRSSGNITS